MRLCAGVVELERRWRAAGRARPPGRGLLEHATTVPEPLGGPGERIIGLYYRGRYAGAPVTRDEIAGLEEALRSVPS